jgi:hypothetical protein
VRRRRHEAVVYGPGAAADADVLADALPVADLTAEVGVVVHAVLVGHADAVAPRDVAQIARDRERRQPVRRASVVQQRHELLFRPGIGSRGWQHWKR